MTGVRQALAFAAVAAALSLAGCGGGRSTSIVGPPPAVTSPASMQGNVQPIQVNTGPTAQAGDYAYTNGAFTSITLCAPGTGTCQTIGGILVDTGSVGLRVLSSTLTISLPQQTQGGNAVGECYPFPGAVTWGSVETADVEMAGEKAGSVPIEVIGGTGSFSAAPPPSCTAMGTPEQNLSELHANGILGIGSFAQDCGLGCAASGASNVGYYYSCSSSGCQATPEDPADQVANPVADFSTDNNGVAIELPAITSSPPVASAVNGSLIFGIGTESNNQLTGVTVYEADPNTANISTVFKGVSYTGVAFLDSGSSANFIADPTTTNMPICSRYMVYCPSAAVNFSATNVGATGTSGSFTFTVDNADNLLTQDAGNAAFGDLAGPSTTTAGPSKYDFFDWGLPFFYGRTVFTAIEGRSTPAGPGPYYAY